MQLQISHRQVTGAQLSFTAPLAVTSAREDYVMAIPNAPCQRTWGTHVHGGGVISGYAEASLGRDVALGAKVRYRFSDLELFYAICGHHKMTRRLATIEVLYERAGEARMLVGSTTVRIPAGTRLEPPPFAPPRHHTSR